MKRKIIDESVILQTKDITMNFKVGQEFITPIKSVDIAIQANSFNIIYGASGSGKSTLLNILGGLQEPSNGMVEVQGKDLYKLPPDEIARYRANHVGFIHQTNNWIKSLTVLDNVALPLYALGFSRKKAASVAASSLERVGMKSYMNKLPGLLSGGEQQRVAMARALVNDPLFIIADEPTGNLDTTNGDNIMKLLLNCQSEFRRTIILVTHNMEYIPFADHLLRINDGVVEDIKKDDTNRVTDELVKMTKQRIAQLSKIKVEALYAS